MMSNIEMQKIEWKKMCEHACMSFITYRLPNFIENRRECKYCGKLTNRRWNPDAWILVVCDDCIERAAMEYEQE